MMNSFGRALLTLHLNCPQASFIPLTKNGMPREYARALCESFESITPGYHMNKKHWITVMPGPGINEELIRELVMESYLLVVDGLPKYRQPVDPASFGRRED